MPKSYKSLAGYTGKLKKLSIESKAGFFFRGHGNIKFELTPSLYRMPSKSQYERDMLLSLISEAPTEFSNDVYAFEKLVRAQHYGLPTRLLDLTQNPLMGLYFACASEPKFRGQVLVFDAPYRIKFFESDTVSCKANLALLTGEEKVFIVREMQNAMEGTLPDTPSPLEKVRKDCPTEWDSFIQKFNEQPTVRRLVQFIKQEKPYFEPRIDPLDLFLPEVVLPKKNNMRIAAQSGAFIIYGLDRKKTIRRARPFLSRLPKDSNNALTTYLLDVDSTQKTSLLEELSAVGINEYTVYPELDKVAGFIKSKYLNR